MRVTWHRPRRPGVDRGMVIEAEERTPGAGYLVVSNAETLQDTCDRYGIANVEIMGEVPVVVNVS